MLELKTYKNWKEICEDMEWSTTGGNTKEKYLKLLSSLCKYHKEGNKFVIEEIYVQPKEINQGMGGKISSYAEFDPYISDYISSILTKKGKINGVIITSTRQVVNYIFSFNERKIQNYIKEINEKYKFLEENQFGINIDKNWAASVKNIIYSVLMGCIEKNFLERLQGDRYPNYLIKKNTLHFVLKRDKAIKNVVITNVILAKKYAEYKKAYAKEIGIESMFFANDAQWKECNKRFCYFISYEDWFFKDISTWRGNIIYHNKQKNNVLEEIEEEDFNHIETIQMQYEIYSRKEPVQISKKEKEELTKKLKKKTCERIVKEIQKEDISSELENNDFLVALERVYKVELAEGILDYIFLGKNKESFEALKIIKELMIRNRELELENAMLKEEIKKLKEEK